MVLKCGRSIVGDAAPLCGGVKGSWYGELAAGFGDVTRLSRSRSGDLTDMRHGISECSRRGLDCADPEDEGLGEAVRCGWSETLLAIFYETKICKLVGVFKRLSSLLPFIK